MNEYDLLDNIAKCQNHIRHSIALLNDAIIANDRNKHHVVKDHLERIHEHNTKIEKILKSL